MLLAGTVFWATVLLNLWFSVATLAGSAIWSAVLCWVGVTAGQDAALMAGDLHRLTLWLAVGAMLLGVPYWLLVHRVMKRARSARRCAGPPASSAWDSGL